ncbi:MAG TPA: class I SAM-dependent methyltransferase [Sphingomicrobium sp.]|nr:class I SAM-dependent methyltransferase [Sphingomicrobium sp.]
MTSRETTPFLPRATNERTARKFWDAAAVVSFGALQWPWLLKGLHGGTQAEKRRLLQRLDLPADALPNLGSWKADTGLLHLIVDKIERERPRRVVEFGIGATSLVIAAALRKIGAPPHLGFDQHGDFVRLTREWLAEHGLEADFRTAPLAPAPSGWPGQWYDTGPLEPEIDLMIIDGPPWTVHPFTRGAAECLFSLLSPGGIVLLDDAARLGERMVGRQWRKLHPEIEFELWNGGAKGTLIGRKPRSPDPAG